MTSAPESRLDGIKIEHVLAAMDSGSADQVEQPEATEHDWRRPRCLSDEQLERLETFASEVATTIGKKFERLCNTTTNATVSALTLHFAGELVRDLLEGKDQYLPFGRDTQRPCAFLGIPPETSAAWTQLLLGETESSSQEKLEPSELEQSLLLDLLNAVVDAFTRALAQQETQQEQMRSAGRLVTGSPPAVLEPARVVCKIDLEIEVPDVAKSQAYLAIPCDELVSAIGLDMSKQTESDMQNDSAALLEHLKNVTVSVTANLASISLSFEQIMNLDRDDIVLLDKALDEPVELVIEGRTAFRGHPAKSEGQLAVALTRPSVTATRHAAEPILVN